VAILEKQMLQKVASPIDYMMHQSNFDVTYFSTNGILAAEKKRLFLKIDLSLQMLNVRETRVHGSRIIETIFFKKQESTYYSVCLLVSDTARKKLPLKRIQKNLHVEIVVIYIKRKK